MLDNFFSYKSESGKCLHTAWSVRLHLLPCIVCCLLIHVGMPTAELLESTSGPDESSLLHLGVESGNSDIVVYLLSRNIDRRRKVQCMNV